MRLRKEDKLYRLYVLTWNVAAISSTQIHTQNRTESCLWEWNPLRGQSDTSSNPQGVSVKIPVLKMRKSKITVRQISSQVSFLSLIFIFLLLFSFFFPQLSPLLSMTFLLSLSLLNPVFHPLLLSFLFPVQFLVLCRGCGTTPPQQSLSLLFC